MYALCGLVSQLLIAAYYIVVYAFAPRNPNVYATTQFLVAYLRIRFGLVKSVLVTKKLRPHNP